MTVGTASSVVLTPGVAPVSPGDVTNGVTDA